MKGWFNNKYGHSLASRGISVKQLKDITYFPETIDYEDPEEFISAFWIASLKNDFSNYNFDKVFDYTNEILENRLNRYGYLSFDEFYTDENYWNIKYLAEDYIISYDWFAKNHEEDYYKNKVTRKMAKDIYDSINEDRDKSLAGLDPVYDKLFDIYKDIQKQPTETIDKILLMDKMIDLQHHRGSIWVDEPLPKISDIDGLKYSDFLNIMELRNDFESKWSRVR